MKKRTLLPLLLVLTVLLSGCGTIRSLLHHESKPSPQESSSRYLPVVEQTISTVQGYASAPVSGTCTGYMHDIDEDDTDELFITYPEPSEPDAPDSSAWLLMLAIYSIRDDTPVPIMPPGKIMEMEDSSACTIELVQIGGETYLLVDISYSGSPSGEVGSQSTATESLTYYRLEDDRLIPAHQLAVQITFTVGDTEITEESAFALDGERLAQDEADAFLADVQSIVLIYTYNTQSTESYSAIPLDDMKTQLQADAGIEPEAEAESEPVPNVPEAVSFVGKHQSEVIAVFGEEYQTYEYEGGFFLYYEEPQLSFGYSWERANDPDPIITALFCGGGTYPLFGTVTISNTYPALYAQLQDYGVVLEEPEFYHNELDDMDMYAADFPIPGYNGMSGLFQWTEDPNSNHPVEFSVIIHPD